MASRRASCAGSRATKPGQLRDDGLPAPRTHLRESRVLPGLEPPPLVVGQMQLERVQLVEREKVDDLLNELGRVEVARDVEEDPAMAEAGASSIATAGDAGRAVELEFPGSGFEVPRRRDDRISTRVRDWPARGRLPGTCGRDQYEDNRRAVCHLGHGSLGLPTLAQYPLDISRHGRASK